MAKQNRVAVANPEGEAFRVRTDNKEPVRLSERGASRSLHAFTKPLRLRLALLSDLRDQGFCAFEHVSGRENPADILTKRLGPVDMMRAREAVGVGPHGAGSHTSA